MEGLRKRILTAGSGSEWRTLGREVATDPEGYTIILELLASPHERICKYAGYVYSHAGEAAPERVVQHLAELVPLLDADVHPATRRALMRSLSFVQLPEQWLGPVLDRCFGYLEDVEEKTAVRAFAVDIIYQNSAAYPELRAELKSLLEWCLPSASAGLRSKARRLLPRLTR